MLILLNFRSPFNLKFLNEKINIVSIIKSITKPHINAVFIITLLSKMQNKNNSNKYSIIGKKLFISGKIVLSEKVMKFLIEIRP